MSVSFQALEQGTLQQFKDALCAQMSGPSDPRGTGPVLGPVHYGTAPRHRAVIGQGFARGSQPRPPFRAGLRASKRARRANLFLIIIKHSSRITPLETEEALRSCTAKLVKECIKEILNVWVAAPNSRRPRTHGAERW